MYFRHTLYGRICLEIDKMNLVMNFGSFDKGSSKVIQILQFLIKKKSISAMIYEEY